MFLKKEIFKAISLKNPVKLPLSYWILVAIRFALTLLPQRGYIHPDEYFQNVEVIAGWCKTFINYFNKKFTISELLYNL